LLSPAIPSVGMEAVTEEERARLRLPLPPQVFAVSRRNRLKFLRILRLYGTCGRLVRRLNHDPDLLYRLLAELGARVTYESVVQRAVLFTCYLGNSGLPIRAAHVYNALRWACPRPVCALKRTFSSKKHFACIGAAMASMCISGIVMLRRHAVFMRRSRR